MNRFATLLAKKEIADNRRYKQKEIAKAVGLSEPMISRFINGTGFEKTSLENVKRLCDWLGCEIGDLIYLDRTPEPQ